MARSGLTVTCIVCEHSCLTEYRYCMCMGVGMYACVRACVRASLQVCVCVCVCRICARALIGVHTLWVRACVLDCVGACMHMLRLVQLGHAACTHLLSYVGKSPRAIHFLMNMLALLTVCFKHMSFITPDIDLE